MYCDANDQFATNRTYDFKQSMLPIFCFGVFFLLLEVTEKRGGGVE